MVGVLQGRWQVWLITGSALARKSTTPSSTFFYSCYFSSWIETRQEFRLWPPAQGNKYRTEQELSTRSQFTTTWFYLLWSLGTAQHSSFTQEYQERQNIYFLQLFPVNPSLCWLSFEKRTSWVMSGTRLAWCNNEEPYSKPMISRITSLNPNILDRKSVV